MIMDAHQQCMKSAALLFWLTGYCRHACLLHLWFDAGYFACEKKEAKLSASEVPEEVVGIGQEDFRCSSLLTVCQRRLGLSEAEDTRLK